MQDCLLLPNVATLHFSKCAIELPGFTLEMIRQDVGTEGQEGLFGGDKGYPPYGQNPF